MRCLLGLRCVAGVVLPLGRVACLPAPAGCSGWVCVGAHGKLVVTARAPGVPLRSSLCVSGGWRSCAVCWSPLLPCSPWFPSKCAALGCSGLRCPFGGGAVWGCAGPLGGGVVPFRLAVVLGFGCVVVLVKPAVTGFRACGLCVALPGAGARGLLAACALRWSGCLPFLACLGLRLIFYKVETRVGQFEVPPCWSTGFLKLNLLSETPNSEPHLTLLL